ncbi:MAG: FecR domain-containing protein [Tannerella sp.]|nr:FecR domain-containing protein [Tannerella sp.]
MTDRAWDTLCERLTRDSLLTSACSVARPSALPAWCLAAGIAAVLAVAAVVGWRLTPDAGNAMPQYMHVLHNEARSSTLVSMLEDGSVVYLSGETSIRYPAHFGEDRREIALQGNAFFDINRSPECPFFVDTEPVRVEVLGTAFGIQHSERSDFSLSVRRGEVRVTLKKNNRTLRVKAGHTVRLEANGLQLTEDDSTTVNAHLHHIHFKDERLADVVHILNRHTPSLQIEVAPELSDIRLTVAFDDDDPETMVHLICLALDLRHSQHDRTVYIFPGTND